MDASTPDRIQEVPRPGDRVDPIPATDENKSYPKFTPSAIMKLLCGVRDSTNGFSPLKAVAGGLYLILENCEVWPPSCTLNPYWLQSF